MLLQSLVLALPVVSAHFLVERSGPLLPRASAVVGTHATLPVSANGRKIGIVIDSSGSNDYTDPENLRITAAEAINDALVTSSDAKGGKSDLVTVVDFDSSAEVIYELGDPSGATQAVFEQIDSLGGTYIASGVNASIGELTKASGGSTADRTGIVVLTDGEDSYFDELIQELSSAKNQSIRVSFGFLSQTAPTNAEDLLFAIINTGGIYSTIDTAQAQLRFVDLVLANGLTNDDGKVSGQKDLTPLLPGLTTAGKVSSGSGPKKYGYDGAKGENVNITVQAVSGQVLDCSMRELRSDKEIKTLSTDANGLVNFNLNFDKNLDIAIVVGTKNSSEGLFTVALESSDPNRTHTLLNSAAAPSSGPSLVLITGVVFSAAFFLLSGTGALP